MQKNKLLIGILMLGLLVIPQLSYADWGIGINLGGNDRGHHFYRWHDHPHWGLHVHVLPVGYVTIWAGGSRYYYDDGLYYTYLGGDYVLVNPPIGAYVRVIPSDFQPVILDGRTYYTDSGVYYILTKRHGYKVVTAPVVYVQPTYVAAPAVVAQNAFPINVPNNSGGYVTVVIKRSGNGFIGPQGEFYAQFPAVNQLRVMYGR